MNEFVQTNTRAHECEHHLVVGFVLREMELMDDIAER